LFFEIADVNCCLGTRSQGRRRRNWVRSPKKKSAHTWRWTQTTRSLDTLCQSSEAGDCIVHLGGLKKLGYCSWCGMFACECHL